MSYLGFVRPVINGALVRVGSPTILEVGIHYGQTTIPLLQNLISQFESFLLVAVDIKVRGEFLNQVAGFSDFTLKFNGETIVSDNPDKVLSVIQTNSMKFLEAQNENLKFDSVWLDGDHNYYTVMNELKLLEKHVHDHTWIVCDDYLGRYSKEDGFYGESHDTKDNVLSAKREDAEAYSEKRGVRTAIDDFVDNESAFEWKVYETNYEPCILYRPDKTEVLYHKQKDAAYSFDDKFILKLTSEDINDFYDDKDEKAHEPA